MKQKKMWGFAALFVITLVISIPFYSASALAASVQITKNQGEAGIKNYLDAEGDVWTVEALITDTAKESVKPENVKLKIGNNEADFSSCSESPLGVVCEYISPLTDGVKEAEHAFQVIYDFINALGEADSVSNGDFIRADGSAPVIQFFSVKQNSEGEVELNFNVNDKKPGVPSVGLQLIEIVDADTGGVLQSISNFAPGQEEFNYIDDGGFDGILQAPLSGEGRKKIKIRAADRLGHTAASPYLQFTADFVKPEIQSELDMVKFGEFIGEFTGKTDISVDVVETSVPKVIAFSDQAELNGDPAGCEADEKQDDLWHCFWEDVEVKPEAKVSLLVLAKDEAGNAAERTVSKSLTVDDSPPKIEFFGTARQFEGKSFINGRNKVSNRIILEAADSGAGVSREGIRANLGVFGRGSSVPPDECEEAEDILTCYWDVDENLNEGVLTFGLSKFEDDVGNPGEMPEYEFFVDNTGPKVEEIEIYGLSEIGDKDYLQSNDVLKIVFRASESSGMTVLVNLDGLVMDAETKYPEEVFTEEVGEGWQVFHEDSCERVEGFWECTILTDPIKSGPASERLEIRIQDTAGNDAVSWDIEPENVKSGSEGGYMVDINGLLTEDNPDYWEVSSVVPVGGEDYGFIDLDTTTLAPTRLPFKVRLSSDNSNVKALNIELVECLPKSEVQAAEKGGEGGTEEGVEGGKGGAASQTSSSSPAISRNLLYNGPSPRGDSSPAPNIILEFEPFDGRKMFNIGGRGELEFEREEVDYVCKLLIFSKVGKNAVQAGELQDVEISVPFAFSALGALDENLKEEIEQARKDAEITILEVIGTLAKILKWIDYIVQVYQLIMGAIKVIYGAMSTGVEALYKVPAGTAPASAACFGMNAASSKVQFSMEKFVDPVIQVLSCRQQGTGNKLGWYGQWQGNVVDFYNTAANELLGSQGKRYLPARDIKQNLFLSSAGLCLPGIIENVDQYRQVLCRKIVCLENEVAAGLATVQSCDALESVLTCKYVLGELWYLLPFSQFYDQVIGMLLNVLRDPLAVGYSLTILGCGISCPTTGAGAAFCAYAKYFWDVVGYIESIAGFVTTIIAEIDSGGLQYCDSVL